MRGKNAMILSPQMEKIYELLQDDESRFIYEQYVKFYFGNFESWNSVDRLELLSGVLRYAYNRRFSSMNEICPGDSVVQCILDYKIHYDKLYLYPAGDEFCLFVAKLLYSYGVDIEGFIDIDPEKHGKKLFEKGIIPLEEILDNSRILICSYRHNFEIERLLMNSDLYKTGEFNFYCIERINEQQYFGPSFVPPPLENEVFLDIGCSGISTDSIHDFVEFCEKDGFEYKKIIGFETSQSYLESINALTKNLSNIEIHPYAAYSKECMLEFYVNENGMNITDSRIFADVRKEVIPARRIDDIVKDKVTFLKMDIEGGEYQALLGAVETIKKNKPRLAISIYHKVRDIVEIPMLINSLVPDYRFYIRHHSLHPWETILYAVL